MTIFSSLDAIIELLSTDKSLAFRGFKHKRKFADNSRNDSILRLANMLGYTPKRNIPASGL